MDSTHAAVGSADVNTDTNLLHESKDEMKESMNNTYAVQERTPSFFTVTFKATQINDHPDADSGSDVQQQDENLIQPTKKDRLRHEWKRMCEKWGIVVTRQLTYVQKDTFADEDIGLATGNATEGTAEHTTEHTSTTNHHGNTTSENHPSDDPTTSIITMNGSTIRAQKIHDELVLSRIIRHPASPTLFSGAREGDIIHAIYGVEKPNLKLLIGIMRGTDSFHLTLKRMETQYERHMRINFGQRQHQQSHRHKADDAYSQTRPQEKNGIAEDTSMINNREMNDTKKVTHDISSVRPREVNDVCGDANGDNCCDSIVADATTASNTAGSGLGKISAIQRTENETETAKGTENDSDCNEKTTSTSTPTTNSLVEVAMDTTVRDEIVNDTLALDYHDDAVTTIEQEKDIAMQERGGKLIKETSSSIQQTIQMKHRPSSSTRKVHYAQQQNILQYFESRHQRPSNNPNPDQHENVESIINGNTASRGTTLRKKKNGLNGENILRFENKVLHFGDKVALEYSSDDDACGNNDGDIFSSCISDHNTTMFANQNVVQETLKDASSSDRREEEGTNVTTQNLDVTIDDTNQNPDRPHNGNKENDPTTDIQVLRLEPPSSDPTPTSNSNNADNPSARKTNDEDLLTSLIETSIFSSTETPLPTKQSLVTQDNEKDYEGATSTVAIETKRSSKIKPTKKRKMSGDSNSSMRSLGRDQILSGNKSAKVTMCDVVVLDVDVGKKANSVGRKERRMSEDSAGRHSSRDKVVQHKRKRNKLMDKEVDDASNKISRSGERLPSQDPISSANPRTDSDATSTKTASIVSIPTATGKYRQHSQRSRSYSVTQEQTPVRISKPGSSPASPLVRGPSPVTITRQKTSTVSSISAKAGLSTIRSTKMKRLWPDSSVFSKRIMKWVPPQVVLDGPRIRFKGTVRSSGGKQLPVISSSFKDTSDIIKQLSPHILEEGVHSIEQEFLANSNRAGLWTRNVYSMKLRFCTPVDPRPTSGSSPEVRTYEFAFRLDPDNIGKEPATNLGELFVLHSPSWKQQTCLGIIGSNDINSTFLADQKLNDEDNYNLFRLWICVCSEVQENVGWLPDKDIPPKKPDGSFESQTIYALNIGTCADMMRQYEGLKSLACVKTHLKRAVYSAEPVDIEALGARKEGARMLPPQPLTRPSSVGPNVWDYLTKMTNSFQLTSIEKIMSGKVKQNIALVQGPPGTGKTLSTVALVSALMNGTAPAPGAKASGTRVQVGSAFKCNSGPIVNSTVARRILVCAPSNQAVDELAWKIHKNALGPNGKPDSFNIIRVGMLPGENRHDGRGKRNARSSSLYENDRDKYLAAINLDNLVHDIGSKKKTPDFPCNERIRMQTSASGIDKNNRKSRYISFTEERHKILSRCHVICTTLSGAGSKAFIEAVSRDEFPQSEFDAVIIDEACQASEMSCLIPFKFNPNIVVLVGDPKQLPVMTFSSVAGHCNTNRSLFERLHSLSWPVNMLRIQYRMHPEIVRFPSRKFYDDNLITCDSIRNCDSAPWHRSIAFPPYLVWNHSSANMTRGNNGGLSNTSEVTFVWRILQNLSYCFGGEMRDIDIGVISFYNDQVNHVRTKLNKDKELCRWMQRSNVSLQVSTVDGFQGSEKDIIILSCVRSRWTGQSANNDSIGFLKDSRRVNVALTRAKHSLWIIADCDTLSRDALWNDLIQDAHHRDLIAHIQTLNSMLGPRPKKKKGKHHKKKNNNEKRSR